MKPVNCETILYLRMPFTHCHPTISVEYATIKYNNHYSPLAYNAGSFILAFYQIRGR